MGNCSQQDGFSCKPENATAESFYCMWNTTDFIIPDNGGFQSIDGVLYTDNGKTLFAYAPKRTGEYMIPVRKYMVHTVQSGKSKLKNKESYGKSCIFKKTDKMRKRQMNEYAESMNNYVPVL